jgi:hypothetical protein
MPPTVAPQASAIGQALLARKMATNPANAQPGTPPLVGNTARGILPQVGRRLLQANPSQMAEGMPSPAGQQFGGGF